MNPMTNMKNVKKLSEQELHRTFKTSWHDQYKDSAWIFVGGLPYDLTEGDLICVFSQYGEIVNLNLVRDKDTGKQKGFCFVCYEDQRSTVLAVDNFNGIKILGRTIRVDHVSDYKMPKDHKNSDAETRKLHSEGCGPGAKPETKPNLPVPSIEMPAFAKENEAPPDGFRLPPRLPIGPAIKIEDDDKTTSKKVKVKKEKKHKKDKKSKKKKSKKHKKKASSSESSNSSDSSSSEENSSDSEDEDSKSKTNKDHKKSSSSSDEVKIKIERRSEDVEQPNLNKQFRNDYPVESYRNHKRGPMGSREDSREQDRYFKHPRRDFEDKYGERKYDKDDDKHRKYSNDKDGDRKRRPDDRREDSKRYRR